MSVLLTIIAVFVSTLTSLYYMKKREDQSKIIKITVLVDVLTIIFVSLIFFFNTGRYTNYILVASIFLLLVLSVLWVRDTGKISISKLFDPLLNSLINVILVLIPFILLIRGLPHLHPIFITLLWIVSSSLLLYLSRYLPANMGFGLIAIIVAGLLLGNIDYLFSGIRTEITQESLKELDNVFSTEINMDNIFDSSPFNDFKTSDEVWINDVKVIDNTLYYTIFIYEDDHYSALVSIDLDTKESTVVLEIERDNGFLDYIEFDNGILITTHRGTYMVKDGEEISLSGIFPEDKVESGVFVMEDTLKYYTKDSIYTFNALDNVTSIPNPNSLESYNYNYTNGLYQISIFTSEEYKNIYDANQTIISVDDYYKYNQIQAYDLQNSTNNLNMTEVYSGKSSDGLKGLFMSQYTIVELNGKSQLIPTDFIKGYVRDGEDIYFYCDQTFVDRYTYSQYKYSSPAIYTTSLGDTHFSSDSFVMSTTKLVLLLFLVLRKKKEIQDFVETKETAQ